MPTTSTPPLGVLPALRAFFTSRKSSAVAGLSGGRSRVSMLRSENSSLPTTANRSSADLKPSCDARSADGSASGAVYPVDVAIEATDRQGLLRDISGVFTKEKMNVIGVQTQSVKDNRGGTAWMTFTVEVAQSGRLKQVLGVVAEVAGVRSARRR